jgi:small subunit ribosomal protein S6
MANRRYETLVVFHPEQGEHGAKELANRVRALIEEQQGAVSQILEWGVRELAYPVAKERRGIYTLFEYRVGTAGLREIERNIKLMDPVMRFVSVQIDENAPPATLRAVRPHDADSGEGDDHAGGFEVSEGEGV